MNARSILMRWAGTCVFAFEAALLACSVRFAPPCTAKKTGLPPWEVETRLLREQFRPFGEVMCVAVSRQRKPGCVGSSRAARRWTAARREVRRLARQPL